MVNQVLEKKAPPTCVRIMHLPKIYEAGVVGQHLKINEDKLVKKPVAIILCKKNQIPMKSGDGRIAAILVIFYLNLETLLIIKPSDTSIMIKLNQQAIIAPNISYSYQL